MSGKSKSKTKTENELSLTCRTMKKSDLIIFAKGVLIASGILIYSYHIGFLISLFFK